MRIADFAAMFRLDWAGAEPPPEAGEEAASSFTCRDGAAGVDVGSEAGAEPPLWEVDVGSEAGAEPPLWEVDVGSEAALAFCCVGAGLPGEPEASADTVERPRPEVVAAAHHRAPVRVRAQESAAAVARRIMRERTNVRCFIDFWS